MQWNLITRKFEKQYELDWSLAEYRKGILMELSNDQQILAVAGRLNTKQEGDSDTKQEGDSDAKQEGDSDAKQEGDSNKKQEGDSNTKQEENSRVYFYSTQSGTIIGNQSFEEKFYEKKKIIKKIQKSGKKFDKKSISRIRFIKFEKEEFLFIYFGQEKKSYAITPPTSSSSLNLHSLPNSPSTLKNSGELPLLAEINFILRYHNDQSFNNEIRKYQDDLNSFGEEKWKEDSRDENGVGSQREYIKKRIDDILENYRSKQIEQSLAKQSSLHRSLAQDSLLPEPLDGKRYTWTVQNASHDNILVAGITARWTATNVEIGKVEAYLRVKKENEIKVEFLLLENEDLMLVASFGVQIWTVKANSVYLLYYWGDLTMHYRLDEPKEAMVKQLILLKKKLESEDYKNSLPPPYFDEILRHRKKPLYREGSLDITHSDFLKRYTRDTLFLELYGRELFQKLIQEKNSKKSKQVFDLIINHSLNQFQRGNIVSNSTNLLGIITSNLLGLESLDRFTESFLSSTAFLIPDYHKRLVDKSSTSIYTDPYTTFPFSFNDSCFNRLYRLIKKITPLYFLYLCIFYIFKLFIKETTLFPKKTVKLMIPLLNFATYPEKNYSSCKELFSPPDNIFTSLNSPEYYKWPNVKALVNFKWNTYGRYYHYFMWAQYTTFLLCFSIVATLPQNNLSQINKDALLWTTIILGFIQFTYEFRQFIHDTRSYIASHWNWFDLTALLFPTITSFMWLLNKNPSLSVIAISTLVVELKFLTFFRALDNFGTYFAIIVGVMKKISYFIVILGIIVIAFSHCLHILLRPTTDFNVNEPNYSGDDNNPWNLASRYQSISSDGVIGNSSLIATPSDSTNLFSVFGTGLLAVYFMLTGDRSSVSPWSLKDNHTLAFILVLFSFFTAIYLMNLLIGLLNTAINDTNNEESLLHLRGEILAEIELYMMFAHQRRNKNWFPEILYYEISVEELAKYVKMLEDDENEEISQPRVSNAVRKVIERKKKLEGVI